MMNEWIISSSILIGAVLLGRLLLRNRISLRLRYALWGVVLVRLLLPVQLFTSNFGAGTIARDVDISEPIRQVYVSANEERYEQAYDEAYRWATEAYASAGQAADPVVIENTARELARADVEVDLQSLLKQIWLGGMVVMSAVIITCNVHLSRQMKRRRWEYPVSDCLLPVYVTEVVPTPCIFGLFRPVIYLTPEAVGDARTRHHVLVHEQTHYRHGDHVWSVLRTVCLVLHWYNPLVWLAVKTSKADAELACDEGVLARLGEKSRGDYGRTLIGLTCAAPLSDYLLTATTMTGSAGSIRQRIRLLMQRPRNTILTLTAVILIGVLVVGCTFAGAPETTPPATEPSGPAGDTLGLVSEDGLLVFPGTRWNMTQEEVLTALGLSESDVDAFGEYGFIVSDYPFLGQKAEITFYFQRYSERNPFGLGSVAITFPSEETSNAVCATLRESLGTPLSENSDTSFCIWHSDTLLEEWISPEVFQFWLTDYTGLLPEGVDGTVGAIPASELIWQSAGYPEPDIQASLIFSSYLTIASQMEAIHTGQDQSNRFADPVEEVRYLLGENGDPDNLAALTRLWSGYAYGIQESRYVDPFIPVIVDCVQADEDTIYVYYNRPGSAQLYQAEMAPHEDSWAVVDNVMVLSMADYADLNPRELRQQELRQFQTEFNVLKDGDVNPAACFLVTAYSDITEMDGAAFMKYFPKSDDATEEDLNLLKAKYPEVFGSWVWGDLPADLHRFSAKEIDAVVSRYANIRWDELDEGVFYLEETGSYYNFTTDFGLGGFQAAGGFVYDGGAVVWSDFSALFFNEVKGKYVIQAHLPTIVLTDNGSQPMLPAEESGEAEVQAVLDAFFLAHQENSWLYTDHNYDHLTVLSADPGRTVTFEGETVSLSEFRGNIEYLYDKETYWKHIRQDQGISRTSFSTSCRIQEIDFDGDICYVLAGSGVTFTYTDSVGPSGMSTDFEVLLIRVDGKWLVADVLELYDWFDAENKNNPDFDVNKMIAE